MFVCLFGGDQSHRILGAETRIRNMLQAPWSFNVEVKSMPCFANPLWELPRGGHS